jgi:multidrug efflux pump
MTTLFYDNKHLLLLALVTIFVSGWSAYQTLPRAEDPRINNRASAIITRFPGASAEQVESQITEAIEKRLNEISEILHVDSNSREGVSVINIELRGMVTDSDTVWSKIRDKLSDVEATLPSNAMKPIFDDKRGGVAYSIILGLTTREGVNHQPGILTRLADELADRIRRIAGTELVRVYGDINEEIVVEIDENEVIAVGYHPQTITHLIAASDAKVPAGAIRSNQNDLFIEVSGELDSLQRIAQIPIQSNQYQQITRLGNIANVRKQFESPPREVAQIDGKRGVLIGVRLEKGKRIDLWSTKVNQVIGEFAHEYYGGIEVTHVFDQNTYTSDRLNTLSNNMIYGAGVIFIIIFFMMGWRSAFIVGSALPLCVSLILFGFTVLGFPLHQMSIFGMIIALGLLIDNAIVVVDEVSQQLQQGEQPRQAIIHTVRHLRIPLLSSTLTTIIAFMPIMLLGGNIGEFISSIAVGVTVALISSYVISMTIIPALTGIIKPKSQNASFTCLKNGLQVPYITNLYYRSLQWSMKHPLLSICIALLLPLSGFMRSVDLRDQFFPPADRDHFYLQMWLPEEASIEKSYEAAIAAEKTIRTFPEIKSIHWLIGGSIPNVYYNMLMNQDDTKHYGQAVIHVHDAHQVKTSIPKIQERLNQALPEAKIILRRLGQGPPAIAPVEVRLCGPNIETLRELGEAVRLQLHSIPDVIYTQSQLSGVSKKLFVETDEDQSRLVSLGLTDIAAQLNGYLEGYTGGSVLEETEKLPIRVRFANYKRTRVDTLSSIKLLSTSGKEWIPLSSLGRVNLIPETNGIPHRNGERCNSVLAYLHSESLPPEVTQKLLAGLKEINFTLPHGYRMEVGGDTEEQIEAISALLKYVPVLTIVMIATMVLSFRSFVLSGLLGAVAIASIGLGILAVWFSGFPYGFNPMIGTAGLIGVAINDSIVVLAALRSNPKSREGDPEAIIHQVMATSRHLLSTTLTTIGGFIPLLVFSGGDFWPPLAIVIAGGVAGATFMATHFIPPAFLLLQRTRLIS